MKDVNKLIIEIKDGNLIIDENMFAGSKIKIRMERKYKLKNKQTEYHSILTLDKDVVEEIRKVLK